MRARAVRVRIIGAPETTAWYIAVTILGVVSYLWSLAQILVLSYMTVSFVIQLILSLARPGRFPKALFHHVKEASVIIGSMLLLLIRWGQGVYAEEGLGIHLTASLDLPPLPYGFAAWVTVIIAVGLNILEAVVTEWISGRGWWNCTLGVGLMASLASVPHFGSFPMAWVVSYTIWNCVFCLRHYGVTAGYVHCSHNIAALLPAVVFGSANSWLYYRAHALGGFLAAYYPLIVWRYSATEWRNRWKGPGTENASDILSDSITLSGVILGWIGVILCWIRPLHLA